MTAAGVPIVFPGGGRRRKLFSYKSIQHELLLSNVVRDSFVWSKDLLVIAQWRYAVDVTFGTSPDLFYIGYQQNRGHFSRSTRCKMTGLQWRFFTGICCSAEVYFLVWVHHLSVGTSRKSSLPDVTERSAFAGVEGGVRPTFYKLSWIQLF